jgi:hypothetical protein
MTMNGEARIGWSYWIVSLLSLLWNAFGCFDYYMTQTRNAAYLANFPPDVIAFIDSLPGWVHGAWAVGVWGSLLGSILLLLRSRWAVAAFGVSLLGLAASQIHQLLAGMPASMTTPAMLAMQAFIWIVLLFLIWYAQWARAKAILR